ncbi:hypothetical protein TrVFT333_008294 [Trichoderma virens FT-333]|nr:hypothetical protein TrVFT333_008294 [Trichoderma virens FT-333]
MSNISTHRWDAEVCSLLFTCPSLRTSRLNILVDIVPGVDIGWINSVTVFLFYDHALIGEVTRENTIVTCTYYKDALDLEMGEFEIQDMIAFRSFVRGIMPKTNDECQLDDGKPTARLELVEKGHKLNISINLNGIGSLKTTTPIIRFTSDSIKITFTISNTAAVEIYFEDAEFKLRQGWSQLAKLTGGFNIEATGKKGTEYILTGNHNMRYKPYGKAILTAYSLKENEGTWFIYALREFEIEVDLDTAVWEE